MIFSYKLGNVELSFELTNTSIIERKGENEREVLYTEIKKLRLGNIVDTEMLTIITNSRKKIIISCINNEENKDIYLLYQNFIKELHSRLSLVSNIKYIRGNPFLFGFSIFALILLIIVFLVFLLDNQSIKLPSISALVVGVIPIIIFIKSCYPRKYNPKNEFE